MRTSQEKINSTLNKQIIKTLASTLNDFKSPEEVLIFLTDFFNTKELESYAKRLAVAYWLKKKRNYKNIKTNLKVSSATIASIHKQMNLEGYKLALKTIEAEEWANQWAKKISKAWPTKSVKKFVK